MLFVRLCFVPTFQFKIIKIFYFSWLEELWLADTETSWIRLQAELPELLSVGACDFIMCHR